MPRYLLPLLLSLLPLAPAAAQDYFQQGVAYDIEVALNDETDELLGKLTLEYTNNSPDVLTRIPFHIWPNAYSSTKSAFNRQKLRNGSTRFHFADRKKWGALDGLNFTVDGQPARHEADPNEVDIVHLPLPSPLQPGQTITIRTPFRVDIPASFSRLGHIGDSYQITQWYPKPAVYDQDGWNAMPYLDQGEFYSEFGNFRVRITLPDNYVVGATGTLEDGAERAWLLENAGQTPAKLAALTDADTNPSGAAQTYPQSSATTKTLTYTAQNVHDFAWFADKRFMVLHDKLEVPGQGEIDVWSLFTKEEADLWAESLTYLKRSTLFYSEHVGAYPYPQVTAVQSALSAGAGMEYPMITVIGLSGNAKALDEVITHEVGHNWFYGVLGSNERASAWMDEGINSYYEGRYMSTYYGGGGLTADIPLIGELNLETLGYRYLAAQGKDQAPDTDADSLSQWNYWIQAYTKPKLALVETEAQTGPERLDAAIQMYYEQFKFKHPRPEDFFRAVSPTLGPANTAALRSAIMTTETGNWSVSRRREGGAYVKHRGDRPAPAAVEVRTHNGDTSLVSLQAEPERQAVGDATSASVRLPSATNPLDLRLHDNAFGGSGLRIGFGSAPDSPGRDPVFLFPLAGYNIHDGFQAGVAIHNRTLEPKKFEWLAAPMFALRSKALTGFGGARYRLVRPFDGVRQIMLSYGLKSWSDLTLPFNDDTYSYIRGAGRVSVSPAHPAIDERESEIFLQYVSFTRDRPIFGGRDSITGLGGLYNQYVRLGYNSSFDREINPFRYSIVLEYKDRDREQNEVFEASHLRLDASVSGGLQYERDKFFRYRIFGGYFLDNALRDRAVYPASALSLVDNAAADYRYDGVFLGRNNRGDQPTWPQQQLGFGQGGFRAPIPNSFSGYKSNDFMVTANLDIDLPLKNIPIGVFLDAGYYNFRAAAADADVGTFSWTGGVSLTALDGKVGIYAPLVADPATRFDFKQMGGLLERVSVRVRFDALQPWRLMDGVL